MKSEIEAIERRLDVWDTGDEMDRLDALDRDCRALLAYVQVLYPSLDRLAALLSLAMFECDWQHLDDPTVSPKEQRDARAAWIARWLLSRLENCSAGSKT